ncbi:MAG: hypothetical protein WCK34_06040 [Bacteroidota bacterium]
MPLIKKKTAIPYQPYHQPLAGIIRDQNKTLTMESTKGFRIFLILLILAGCSKDKPDFRTKYLGNFRFKIVTESWMIGQPTTYDTSFYDGAIRKFELTDSQNDLEGSDNSAANPNERITIEFKKNQLITPLINEYGTIISKSGYHYSHRGYFKNIDTIEFYVGDLGGLGAGYSYNVKGGRIK